MITSYYSPAGVGCCEVVSDDVFSLSVPLASDAARVKKSVHVHITNIHYPTIPVTTHQLEWVAVRWSQMFLSLWPQMLK